MTTVDLSFLQTANIVILVKWWNIWNISNLYSSTKRHFVKWLKCWKLGNSILGQMVSSTFVSPEGWTFSRTFQGPSSGLRLTMNSVSHNSKLKNKRAKLFIIRPTVVCVMRGSQGLNSDWTAVSLKLGNTSVIGNGIKLICAKTRLIFDPRIERRG